MDYKEKYEHDFEEELRNLQRHKPNLMLVGTSGAGKSSLINKIFGENVARVGSGKPVTTRIEEYTSEKSLINIFDTIGYEVKGDGQQSNEFETKVIYEIQSRQYMPLDKHIHIIWYCLPITNHRVFPYDIDNIKHLKQLSIPLFLVFTKCDEDSEDANGKGVTSEAFKISLRENNLDILNTFDVSTFGDETFQLDDLINISANSLKDENLKNAFIKAQLHNLNLKREDASVVIHTASFSSGAAAAIPIPIADAPIIVSIQMGMALKLATIYGFGALGESASALLKTQIISMVGKQLASSLTKLIPFFGSIINASVAASFTEGLGWGLVTIYENVLEEYLKTGKEPQWATIFSSDIFMNIIKQRFSKD